MSFPLQNRRWVHDVDDDDAEDDEDDDVNDDDADEDDGKGCPFRSRTDAGCSRTQFQTPVPVKSAQNVLTMFWQFSH